MRKSMRIMAMALMVCLLWTNSDAFAVDAQQDSIQVLKYSDGTYYVGQVNNHLANGIGSILFVDGGTLQGEFKDGVLTDGIVIYTMADGTICESNQINGVMVGKAKYVLPNGAIYYIDAPLTKTIDSNSVPDTTTTTTPQSRQQAYASVAYGDELLKPTGSSTGLYDYSATFGKGVYSPYAPGTKTLSDAGQRVIDTNIDGYFEGWHGNSIFVLMNGQIWQQSSYDYAFHYSYYPRVIIYKSGSVSKMHVEGLNKDINVIRLK